MVSAADSFPSATFHLAIFCRDSHLDVESKVSRLGASLI